ncbi:MAG: inositol monophosphatase [Solirubrobacterales bacterium]|nr:inositol monophosphatase [Solirubrobacterales bacterium]
MSAGTTNAELVAVAVAAARAAAPELLERFDRGAVGVSSKSTATDLVSEADLAAERTIRELLARERPEDAIMGEEGEDTPGTSGLRWIVDPLDGTINYLYGHPQWCVSVACEDRAGVVFDPVRDELWAVAVGERPTLNGEPLADLGPAPELGAALLATGFGYAAEIRAAQAQIAVRMLPRVRDLRRAGAAALDLAWAAAGRLDAYYEHGVKPWDIAAGTLLCEGVGLHVEPLPATDALPPGILTAPPELAGELRALVDDA